MTAKEIFASDFKTTPYWWDGMARWEEPQGELPPSADVVVIGAGLSGSAAAATLARAGKKVLLLDAQYPGFGASARSAGFLSRHFKHSLTDLVKKYGEHAAIGYFTTLEAAYAHTLGIIREEKLDCDFQERGRFIAAMDEQGFNTLKKEYALRGRLLNEEYELLEDGGQTEYCSERVIGGVLLRDQASIHPGRYVQAMAERAIAAGAQLFCFTAVTRVAQSGQSFVLQTSRGEIRAKNVIVATNGYSDNSIKWVKNGLIPIRGYQITTEPLPEGLLDEILPYHRTYTDRRNASNYLRPTPDGRRLLFGGQTGALLEDKPETVAALVYDEMLGLFPQLEGIRLSHVWSGRCAATIDQFPKIGQKHGMYYALAYCFSGNVLAPFFGHQLALKILGQQPEITPFERRKFYRIPFYTGNAWFVPVVQKYYEFLDKIRR